MTGKLLPIEQLLQQRILILDGAMGTMIQRYKLTEAHYRGTELFGDYSGARQTFVDHPIDVKGCNDLLLLTQPRFVAGVLGPTGRTASISPDVNDPGARNVSFDELVESYAEAVRGLLDGGADILMVETIFDTLNAKAALFAIERHFEQQGVRVPIMISGTITDASGRTLSGQTTEAFYNSLAHVKPLSIGLNCALGAELMRPYVEEMSCVAGCYVSAHPNAGLPNPLSETGYDETPETTARLVKEFATSGFLNIAGGRRRPSPAHLKALAEALKDVPPRKIPPIEKKLRLSGLEPFNVGDDSLFVNVGERANVTGSARVQRVIFGNPYREGRGGA